MSPIHFVTSEFAATIVRGVRQCVVIGLRPPWREALNSSPDNTLHVFAVDEEQPSDSSATFVSTQFASEALATTLEKSDFDKLKASLFVWFGGAEYRTLDAAMASFRFIASLPPGSGVLFDYAVERTCPGSLTHTALDALASRIMVAGGGVTFYSAASRDGNAPRPRLSENSGSGVRRIPGNRRTFRQRSPLGAIPAKRLYRSAMQPMPKNPQFNGTSRLNSA